ncbi:MAG: hypothetical protein QM489_00390 [Candidatus Izemoplasma sp.]
MSHKGQFKITGEMLPMLAEIQNLLPLKIELQVPDVEDPTVFLVYGESPAFIDSQDITYDDPSEYPKHQLKIKNFKAGKKGKNGPRSYTAKAI